MSRMFSQPSCCALWCFVLWAAVGRAALGAPMYTVVPAANNVYSFYIDGDDQNGKFDTLYFETRALTGEFLNVTSGNVFGVPRPPGDPFTYGNTMIMAHPDEFPGGLMLVRDAYINNSQELSYLAAKFGGKISTASQSGGDLFLGNVMLSDPQAIGAFRIWLLSAGLTVYDTGVLQFSPTIPEPACTSLMAAGILSVWFSRLLHRPQLRECDLA